jgi:hypothetical protein
LTQLKKKLTDNGSKSVNEISKKMIAFFVVLKTSSGADTLGFYQIRLSILIRIIHEGMNLYLERNLQTG